MAWLHDRQPQGPTRATMHDIEALNRMFSEAFTDRYRRDGLGGVRVPPLNSAIWRYALEDAEDGAMVWRDEAGALCGFNIAHRSGHEGWMGPLAVRPDRQGRGLGKEMLAAANNLEFEKAALLRDQIKELKRAIDGSQPAKDAKAVKPVSYRKSSRGSAVGALRKRSRRAERPF